MSVSNITDVERKARYQKVRASFVEQGTTLTGWCRENGHHIQNVRDAFFGRWNGPAAQALILNVEAAAGLSAA